MSSSLSEWSPPPSEPPSRRPAWVGKAVLGGAAVLILLIGAGIGSSEKNDAAAGPAATGTVTATATVSATATMTATATATATVTHAVQHVVTRTVTRTVTAAAAAQAPAGSSGQGSGSGAGSQQDCTPGYSPCIPPGPDVDCAGGSGNGPRYVQGPIQVTGSDPYDLDRDGDGIGCDN